MKSHQISRIYSPFLHETREFFQKKWIVIRQMVMSHFTKNCGSYFAEIFAGFSGLSCTCMSHIKAFVLMSEMCQISQNFRFVVANLGKIFFYSYSSLSWTQKGSIFETFMTISFWQVCTSVKYFLRGQGSHSSGEVKIWKCFISLMKLSQNNKDSCPNLQQGHH